MQTYIVTMSGCATCFVSRKIEVLANSWEDAVADVENRGYQSFEYSEEIELDDDYTEIIKRGINEKVTIISCI